MTTQWILQATLLMAVALMVGFLAGQRISAARRHLIYLTAVLAILAIPLVPRAATIAVSSASVVEIPVFTVRADTVAPVDWMAITVKIWLTGAILLATRYLIGMGRAAWLIRTSTPFRDGARLHRSIRVPMVVGWLRPRILLPASAPEWPEERISSAIAHERSHIERLDCLWALFAAAATAIYWFHPLVWMLMNRMRQESERSCDDSVILCGTDARDYAEHLLEAAREAGHHWEPVAGIAMADAPKLESRVVSVLDRRTVRTPVSRMFAAAVTASAGVLLFLVTGAITGRAQDVPQGTLEITVVDPSGARVADAGISVEDGSGKLQVMRKTSAEGIARIDSLPPADYLVEVKAPGFRPAIKGIRLQADNGSRVAIALDMGRIYETVKVSGGIAAAPQAPTTPTRIRIGGNVQAAKLRNRVQVLYPPSAKSVGIQGTVFLQAVVLMDGTVGSLEVLSAPHPDLATAATDAVRQWVYEPTLLNGSPIEVVTKINVNFTLSE